MFGNELFISRRLRKTGISALSGLAFAVLASPFVVIDAQANCDGSGICEDDLNILLRAEELGATKPKKAAKTKSSVSISVDGETVVGNPTDSAKISHIDKQLENVDIQIKFDGLDVTRRLNIATRELRRTYRPGEKVDFVSSWNYQDWIDRAEIRIFREVDKPSTQAVAYPVETIDVPVKGSQGGKVTWRAFDDLEQFGPIDGDFVYVLRVYDSLGRFDETTPIRLKISENDITVDERLGTQAVAPGEGDDRTGISNIPLYGGSVTVHGRNVPPGYTVTILGEEIPVDEGQKFVTSRILPSGEHIVDVSVNGGITKNSGLNFEREINIPDSEWFYVGLADLTLGKRLGPDASILNQVDPDEFSETFQRGRLAFYVKGKIKGETILTAAFDTTEQELDDLFDNLDRKDPRRLLRNLDPDEFYPVFGDDSTTVDDAPTSGKFYLRLERGKSHVLWGNFKTSINGTELTRFERSLYGGHARLVSPYVTSHGEPVAEAEVFAAEPGSLPQRDEFRGTGGSAYFLQRQDVNQGSEQIYVELRNRITGEVVERTLLRPDEDYEIDYIQGVVLLRRPLQSRVGTTGAVRQEVIGDLEQVLIVTYEFTPTLTDLDGFTYGGRGQVWITEGIRLGTTGFIEDTGLADQTLYGADILIRISEKSYFEFEWAESEGDNFGQVVSTDGGFIFNPISGVNNNGRAQAIRGKVNLDLGELTNDRLQGVIGGYYEQRDAGFNAPGRFTSVDERLTGIYADVEVNEDTNIRLKFDQIESANGNDRREGSFEVEHRFGANKEYTVSTGVTHSDFDSPIGSTTGTGSRTDVGARLTKAFENDDEAWVFGQATVEKSGTRRNNHRIGAGLIKQINDKLSAEAEISYGSLGIGGLAALNYSPNADDRYYLGYRLDPDTTAGDLNGYDPFGRDLGSIVYGANKRINDQLTAVFEENYDFTGTQRSLTHTYGVTYTPDAAWTIGAGFEAGEVFDDVNGDFDRVAISGEVSLRDEVKNASLRFEARFEDGIQANVRDRTTYLLSGQFGYRQSDDWRFIASFDAVISESDQTTILDGDFIEGSVGYAYRPVDNDRLNALFRYTYLEDLPGSQQVNVQNQILGPRQRSHILEADFIYDVTERISVGGKYGFRIGELETVRGSNNFVDSSAHLAIARADIHIVNKWDLLLEARALWLPEVDQTNIGYLAGIYRHIGKNLKLGVGYNFSNFSDDLTDVTFDDEGVFVNVIGKF